MKNFFNENYFSDDTLSSCDVNRASARSFNFRNNVF